MTKIKTYRMIIIFLSLSFCLNAHSTQSIKLVGHKYEVHSVSFSNDGKYLISGSGDQRVIIWDLQTREPSYIINNHNATAYAVAFSKLRGHIFATSSSDGHLILWDLRNRKIIKTLSIADPTSSGILGLDFSPTENLLAVAHMGGELTVWNTKTFKRVGFTRAHPYGFAMSVHFSPDGRKLLTTGGIDYLTKLFDTNSLKLIQSFNSNMQANTGAIWDAAFSPNGKTFATVASSGYLNVWREGDGKPLVAVKVNEYLAQSVAYSHDGRDIYVGVAGFNNEHENYVKKVNAYTGDIKSQFNAHKNRIRGMNLSHDGRNLATAGWDDTVMIWKFK